MRRLRPWGTAVAAAGLLVPALAAPAGAVCTPAVRASAELLHLELPSVPVPLVPPRNASASVEQVGEGSDSASGSTNRLDVPFLQQTFRITNGTGTAVAAATVDKGRRRSSASALVDGLSVTVPAIPPVTPKLIVTATLVQASASVDSAGTPDADVVVAELRVNGVPVSLSVPGDSVTLPGGVTLEVSNADSAVQGAEQTASATALALRLPSGDEVVIASATAELTSCP